jgi:hypothetical protein
VRKPALAPLLRRGRDEFEAEAVGRARGQTDRHGLDLFLRVAPFAQRQAQGTRRPVAIDLDLDLAARARRRDDARKVGRILDVALVEAHDHVALDDAAERRRTTGLHTAHQRTRRARQPETVGEVAGDLLDRHPDAPALHPALLAQLLLHVHRDIDRDRERQTHEPAVRL